MKGLAISAVVIIHVVNNLYRVFPVHGSAWNMLVGIDQLSRYCVPLFVFLSGFALAKKYEVEKFEWKSFLTKRLWKLLPLYLIWTMVYFLGGRINSNLLDLGSFGLWLKIIVSGTGYYHLYFVPMIIQAYLLFPFIYSLVKKYPRMTFGLSLLLQLGLYILFYITHLSDQIMYVMFISWQFYFVLGILLTRFEIKQRYQLLVLSLIGLTWTLFSSFSEIQRGSDLIWATRFTKWPVMIYASGLILWLMKFNLKSEIMKWLGKHSYLIYLSHVFFLQIIVQGQISTSVLYSIFLGVTALVVSVKFFKG